MAIENFDEVKTYFDTNKDTEEIKNYIGGLNPMTTDRANAFLNTEDGKKLLQPKLDTYHSKGLDTWKTNNLDKIYQERFTKEHPEADPKDLKYQELENKFNAAEKARLRETLTNKALKTAQEKNLPGDLIDFFIGADDESTQKNLDKFLETMAAHDETIKTEFAKSNSYIPPNGAGANLTDAEKTRAEIAKWMK